MVKSSTHQVFLRLKISPSTIGKIIELMGDLSVPLSFDMAEKTCPFTSMN
jgi:hypothetical protein